MDNSININSINNFSGTSTMSTQNATITLIKTVELADSIEFIYMETSNNILAVYPARPPARRVFKIVFSCVDGMWNKSAPIYGNIRAAQSEYYDFN
jgi:hypothetical protein